MSVPVFITYALIAFMAGYAILLVVDLILARAWKRFLVQAMILSFVVLLLNVTTGFPTPRQAFGGAPPLVALVIMFVCTIGGMAAHYGFYVKSKDFSWLDLLRPMLVSPIVLLPLLGSMTGGSELTVIQLISFGFLAFQNGFFWKVVLEHAAPKT